MQTGNQQRNVTEKDRTLKDIQEHLSKKEVKEK